MYTYLCISLNIICDIVRSRVVQQPRPPSARQNVSASCVWRVFCRVRSLACPNGNTMYIPTAASVAAIVISDKGPLWIKTGGRENPKTAAVVRGGRMGRVFACAV